MKFFKYLSFRRDNKNKSTDKYQKILIDYYDQKYIPKFYIAEEGIENQDSQITEHHPDYFKIFKKKEHKQDKVYTQEYITKMDDSLSSIALKLNIGEHVLKKINQMSLENIFPGMKILIPSNLDISLLDQKQQQKEALEISQNTFQSDEQISKYQVYFCTPQSDFIKGVFTIKTSYILFNPTINAKENKGYSMEQLLKYNFIIDIEDVKEIWPLISKQHYQYGEIGYQYNVIKIYLLSIGNRVVSSKVQEKINELKEQQKAIAVITFKIYQQEEKKSLAIKHEIVQKIYLRMLSSQSQEKLQKNKLTTIPAYQLLIDNSSRDNSLIQNNLESLKTKSCSMESSLTKMIHQSILPHQQFIIISKNFNGTDKFHNWQKIYQCTNDGSSFQNFKRICKSASPLLLIIKEYKGNIFGAYIIQQLEVGKSGTGEMFIWKYSVKQKKTTVYNWTHKNNFFCYLDDDGVGIGMGRRYGIFIKSNLEVGHSGSTDTFGNHQSLSLHQQFEIEDIEIWTLSEQQF